MDSLGQNALLAILTHPEVNIDLFNKLIELKINVNQQDEKGNTALHYAKTPELASILLQEGADVNKKNKEYDTHLESLAKTFTEKGLMLDETFAQIAKESIKNGANSHILLMWSDSMNDPILEVYLPW